MSTTSPTISPDSSKRRSPDADRGADLQAQRRRRMPPSIRPRPLEAERCDGRSRSVQPCRHETSRRMPARASFVAVALICIKGAAGRDRHSGSARALATTRCDGVEARSENRRSADGSFKQT
jgi:hypothetical protein